MKKALGCWGTRAERARSRSRSAAFFSVSFVLSSLPRNTPRRKHPTPVSVPDVNFISTGGNHTLVMQRLRPKRRKFLIPCISQRGVRGGRRGRGENNAIVPVAECIFDSRFYSVAPLSGHSDAYVR